MYDNQNNCNALIMNVNYQHKIKFQLVNYEVIKTQEREYIIVCNEHNVLLPGCLLFWGHKTKDDKKRSFVGYTSDIDNCEMYTLDEIKQKNYNFPLYNSRLHSIYWMLDQDDVVVKKSDLLSMKGFRTMKVVYRP